MKLKHLEAELSKLIPTLPFPNPTISLEQYPTNPHLAASVAYIAFERGDFHSESTTLDLGCGTGILGISSLHMSSSHTTFFDIDPTALQVAEDNVALYETWDEEETAFVNGSVRYHPAPPAKTSKAGKLQPQKSLPILSPKIATIEHDGLPYPNRHFTTTLTNPPFGTKNNAGIDMQFLAAAIRVSDTAVYSFHKTSTRAHVLKTVEGWGYGGEVVAEMVFDVANTYKFHTKKNVGIEVDLIRVDCREEEGEEGGEMSCSTVVDDRVWEGATHVGCDCCDCDLAGMLYHRGAEDFCVYCVEGLNEVEDRDGLVKMEASEVAKLYEEEAGEEEAAGGESSAGPTVADAAESLFAFGGIAKATEEVAAANKTLDGNI